MQPIWKQHYPKGIPTEIDTSKYNSIAELFHNSIDKYRDRPAYTNLGKTLSYDDLDRLSRHFSAYLTAELGLQKGDRVAIMLGFSGG